MYVQKTFNLKPADTDKKWYLVDAQDMVVGRLATQLADILRGKNSPKYTPNTDSGDFLVIINADKVKFTGKKWSDKKYYWHSNFVGGLKSRTAQEQLDKHPELIVMNAVKGMLPKTSLGRQQLTKLKVYTGVTHPHAAQNLETLELNK